MAGCMTLKKRFSWKFDNKDVGLQ